MSQLKPHHKLILQVLLARGGSGSYKQVADAHPDLHSNGVSQSFGALADRGLVVSVHVDSDPAHHGVVLTPEGRTTAEALGPIGDVSQSSQRNAVAAEIMRRNQDRVNGSSAKKSLEAYLTRILHGDIMPPASLGERQIFAIAERAVEEYLTGVLDSQPWLARFALKRARKEASVLAAMPAIDLGPPHDPNEEEDLPPDLWEQTTSSSDGALF